MYRSHSTVYESKKKCLYCLGLSGSSEDRLLLRESEPGAEGDPSPSGALPHQGMVLQHLSTVGRDKSWKQGPSIASSRVPSGATGNRAADRTGHVAAVLLQRVHVQDGAGDRSPYIGAQAGTSGSGLS